MNTNKMNRKRVIGWEKIKQLPTTDDLLDEKYGKEGTPTREAFNREADAYYEKHYCNNGCGKKKQTETVRENVLVSEEK